MNGNGKELKPGPTGDFPDGKISPDDDGGLVFKIIKDVENQRIILDFGKNVSWLGFLPEQALEFAKILVDDATELMAERDKAKESAPSQSSSEA
jgi:hypothetical protein